MTKEIWINLPVRNAQKSKAFFTAIGFTLNTRYNNSGTSASFMVGSKDVVLMLFEDATFEGFTNSKVADTKQFAEVLFSIDAESREEVDGLAEKAAAAGGVVFARPSERDGWMYGCAFSDLDGHRWNVLHMDMSKMPR